MHAMQFARGRFTAEEVAIKFFTRRDAFEREAALYRTAALSALMPHISVLESNAAAKVRTPQGYVFPPFMVVERGEPLDEWANRVQPDFLNVLKVCTLTL